MKLAVKLFKLGNKDQLPEGWPEEVLELHDKDSIPIEYIEMTTQEYKDHKARLEPLYKIWLTEIKEPAKLIANYEEHREKLFEKLDNDFNDAVACMAQKLKDVDVDIGKEMENMLVSRAAIKGKFPRISN